MIYFIGVILHCFLTPKYSFKVAYCSIQWIAQMPKSNANTVKWDQNRIIYTQYIFLKLKAEKKNSQFIQYTERDGINCYLESTDTWNCQSVSLKMLPTSYATSVLHKFFISMRKSDWALVPKVDFVRSWVCLKRTNNREAKQDLFIILLTQCQFSKRLIKRVEKGHFRFQINLGKILVKSAAVRTSR